MHPRTCKAIWGLLLLTSSTLTSSTLAADADSPISPQQLEFFEKKIRPVLVEHCYECHSATAKKLRGELLLDSKPGWQAGGESGESISVGHASDSLLIDALKYESFEMPPKGKLPADVIADFETWIDMGAPDPRTDSPAAAPVVDDFDIEQRRQWWSLQPVKQVSVPSVSDNAWPRSDYDRFVLSRLEQEDWKPAKPATRNSWLRRVTYDLTGLPPTPEDVRAFIADDSDAAFESVVDRLLRSPHFGEQWARHWMDLVRYAETKAFEADYPMPNAFQYRDYLIRAFNDDVPYNQFLMEAVAGDLIPPRINPDTQLNESVIGPGYFYLTDGQHGPPDVHLDEARIFDDMIDVLGKAFLSQTVACARCHDHKFDAIATADYYSLYGIIASSRIDYADINPAEEQQRIRTKLAEQKAQVKSAIAELVRADLAGCADDLRAVIATKAESAQQKRWQKAIEDKPNSVLKLIASLLTATDSESLAQSVSAVRKKLIGQSDEAKPLGELTADDASFGQWIASGIAFGESPRGLGDFVVSAEGDRAISTFIGARIAAGDLTSRLAGSLKSPTFTIEGDHVSIRVKGKNARVNLYVRHYELVGRGPTTGGTSKVINTDGWQTIRFDTRLWVGEPAYIEVQHNGGEINFKWVTGEHVDGAYAVVDTAVLNASLPDAYRRVDLLGLNDASRDDVLPSSVGNVVERLAKQIQEAAVAWSEDSLSPPQSQLLEALFEAGVIDGSLERSDTLKAAVSTYRELQRAIPSPSYVRTLSDGHGQDEAVYIRGSHRNVSDEPNPRHFLNGIDGTPFQVAGSGRLQWAEQLVADDNPLTARVMVNRVWHHLFGRGIVASVDDFGHMGDLPSHPELLDFMATQFKSNGWSLKTLIRELVLSSSYRMSSDPSSDSIRTDPSNILLQHMPLRRLQAESVRDTLLAVSGRLDRKLFGTSISGDGGNRRSVYIQLRRRFMPEFLMTFDMPNGTEPFGRRNVTAGPTQSLALMNGDFAWKAAETWAEQVSKPDVSTNAVSTIEASTNGETATETQTKHASFEQRINLMHLQAFGRDASDREQEWAKQLAHDLSPDNNELSAEQWKDICHTMLNRKELIYVY